MKIEKHVEQFSCMSLNPIVHSKCGIPSNSLENTIVSSFYLSNYRNSNEHCTGLLLRGNYIQLYFVLKKRLSRNPSISTVEGI